MMARSLSLILLSSVAILVYVPSAYASESRLALDGIGTNTTCQEVGCLTQSLTTTRGNDLIVLVLECGLLSCDSTITAIKDSSGLAFAPRLFYAPNDELREYYSTTTSTLKADNITVVFSPPNARGMQVLAIHGANIREVFDPNPSIPATVPCPNYLPPCSASIRTSTLDFVVALIAINDGGDCGGLHTGPGVPGFTRATQSGNGNFEVDYTITTQSQSNVVFTCGCFYSTGAYPVLYCSSPAAIVIDAISLRGASSK